MNVAKSIVTVLFCIVYLCTFGTISIRAKFPDNTEVRYDGWLF